MSEAQASRFRLPWRRSSAPGVTPRSEWRATIQSRVLVCAALLAVWTCGIEARLVYLQVVAHADLQSRADRQQSRTMDLAAKRGEIFDRRGRVLAYSVEADTIAVDPGDLEDPAGVAARICGALDSCSAERRADIARKLQRKGSFAYLARQVSPAEGQRIRDLEIPKLIYLKENRRYYPKLDLAAHVLGYVGRDNVGLGGVESAYDTQIRGSAGKVLILQDANHKALSSTVQRAATSGTSIELTIDEYLQYIAERELKIGVEENRALSGTAIIMDPKTGEILALANYPTFNPNAFLKFDEDARRNRATQSLYEPGSTFKIVTASAALEQHVINPDSMIDTNPGSITFPGRKPIYDTHRYGVISFTDVIVKSSNVGAIKVGLRLGPETLVQYVNRFGFGQTIAPDFRGETPGIVWSADRLDQSALASVSMGYQVGVTPVQMATAVSAVANGGHLVEPRVVRAFIKNGHRTEVPHKVLRSAIEPQTAATLTAIMEQVVERGTAKAAQIPGYTIAGKTGTAAKLVNGHYSASDYNASFVGFIPSRNPALTILVVIDSPHGNGHVGGIVSAPVFKRIAEAALTYIGVGPNLNPTPPVLVVRHDEPVSSRPVSFVDRQQPVPQTPDGQMPDLRGLSAREALHTLSGIGLTPRLAGDGVVLEQSPEPGSPLQPGVACALQLGRRPTVAAGGPPQ